AVPTRRQKRSVLRISQTLISGNFHQHLRHARLKRQRVVDHLLKFTVLKFSPSFNEQITAFENAVDTFPPCVSDFQPILLCAGHSEPLNGARQSVAARTLRVSVESVYERSRPDLWLWTLLKGEGHWHSWRRECRTRDRPLNGGRQRNCKRRFFLICSDSGRSFRPLSK